MKSNIRLRSVSLAIAVLTAGCATQPGQPNPSPGEWIKNTFNSDDPCSDNARNIGVAGGMVAGLIIGNAIGGGKSESLAVGTLIGGVIGGLIGHDVDRRRCEIFKVAKAHNLDVVVTDINMEADAQKKTAHGASTSDKKGLTIAVIDHGNQFAKGSAVPSDASMKAFADLAETYRLKVDSKEQKLVQAAQDRSKQMRLLLIGHTDDTGSSTVNADLSEARARAIAKIWAQHGFSADQIFFQGAGEVFPIADNRTEEGRARNRRVEIVDLNDDATFNAFLASRKPNLAHYRAATPAVSNIDEKPIALSVDLDTLPQKGAAKTNTAATKKPPTNAASTPATTKSASTQTPGLATDSQPSTNASNGKIKPPVLLASPLDNIDLGGSPANGKFRGMDIGKTAKSSSFSIISSAYAADDAVIGSCAEDHPRISRGVKSLSTGKEIKTADYLPGTASASWAGKVNGNLVGLKGVSVLRDGGQPAALPEVYIWKNYVDGSGAKPDFKTTANVNAYQGEKSLLYRVFITENPVRCIDMLIASKAPNTAPESNIIYSRKEGLYQTAYSPSITR